MFEKIKGFLVDDAVFYGLLVVFVGVASFGLGRLSLGHETIQSASAVTITAPSASLSESGPVETAQNYVASKNGTKYHLPTCSGAKQMSDANKIYFSTEKEAQSAGYTKAANCPGL